MMGRIKSRCAGLLEATNFPRKTQHVQFLHRSVENLLETPEITGKIQQSLSGKQVFIPEYAITMGHLLELITLKARLHEEKKFVLDNT